MKQLFTAAMLPLFLSCNTTTPLTQATEGQAATATKECGITQWTYHRGSENGWAVFDGPQPDADDRAISFSVPSGTLEMPELENAFKKVSHLEQCLLASLKRQGAIATILGSSQTEMEGTE